MKRFWILSLGLCAMLAGSALGATWTLTTADFQTRLVNLGNVDPAGIHMTPAGGGDAEVVPFNQFLELSRALPPSMGSGKFTLFLLGGDSINGEPIGIKGNDLIWSNPTLGEIPISMKQLVTMTRPGGQPADVRRREDVVTLSNGDTLRGIIATIADGKVTVQADAGNNSIPISSIGQINFAASGGTASSAVGFRVRLDDGSAIVSSALVINGEKIELTLGKDVTRTIDLARVAAIEQVNGPVSWLSSRPTIESVYIPFIGTPKNDVAKMNRNWTGLDPIRFGSQEFAHGIGVHSYSRISWTLDGQFATFRTRYAIDTKEANTKADVTVRVLLDGKVVYEQQHVRAGAMSPVVQQALGTAKKLTLEVDYGDNMDTQDRMNWIEPAVLKGK